MAGPIPQALLNQIANLNALPVAPEIRAQITRVINQLAQLVLANQANPQQIQELQAQVVHINQQLNVAQQSYNAQVAANVQLAAANAGLVQANQGYVQANIQLAAQVNQQAVNLANLTVLINARANEIQEANRRVQEQMAIAANNQRIGEVREIFRKRINLLVFAENDAFKRKMLGICTVVLAPLALYPRSFQLEYQRKLNTTRAALDYFNRLIDKGWKGEEAFATAKRVYNLTDDILACITLYRDGQAVYTAV
jgi:hypothetical protein